MVILVAGVLSFAALKLKTRQANNVRMEKMGDILRSINKGMDANNAPDRFAYIEEQYEKYIVNSITANSAGEKVEGDAFAILLNLKAEYDKPEAERSLPLFESRDDDGSIRYIIPVWGSGLWGPLWGYIAFENDLETIHGVIFGHKGETPGLGAEISTPFFENQFKGKTVYTDNKFTGIKVLKGSGSSLGNPSAVDVISGGTITSHAVERMINNSLAGYAAYFENMRLQNIAPEDATAQDGTESENQENINDTNYGQ